MQLLKNHVISNEAEKILKGSLKTFSPSSPSLKIQIMDGNVCLRCEGKTLLGDVNKLFVDYAQQFFAFTPQANFPAHILNFH